MNEDLIKNTVEEDNKEILSALRCGTLTDCIDEVQKSRDRLEQGDLIFIYKNTEKKGVDNELLEVSIRMNNVYTSGPDSMTDGLDLFIVELFTEEYTVIYPHVPRTYLEVELYEILKDSKVPQDILITYKQIIEDLKI
jgi:hypothetical protein